MLKNILALFFILWAVEGKSDIVDTYLPVIHDTDFPTSLLILGDVTSRTPLNLERALRQFPAVRNLLLASDGGDVHAALDTALIVDRYGLTTVIPEYNGCYSACAFIYLAGHERYAYGTLGVHQVDSSRDNNFSTQLAAADIIDILSQFDVPSELFVKMFSTPPDQMYTFSSRELRELGLDGVRKSRRSGAAPSQNPSFRPVQPQPKFSRYSNTDFFGADLTSNGFRDVSIDRCESICLTDSRCTAYSYVHDMSWCWPKSGTGEIKFNTRVMSGVRE